MALRVRLFETFRIETAPGQTLPGGSPTTRSLLAYLFLHRQQPLDRRRLAFLFWPDASETAARRNLRQYLHHVRRALAPLDPDGDWLQTDGHHIRFQPPDDLEVDVETFRALAENPHASLDDLRTAVALYSGDLLQDLYDEWCAPLRETLRQIWLDALARLSAGLSAAGLLDDALAYARRWQQAEPLDENAVRHLMMLSARKGDRPRALQIYQEFARLLEEELDADPLPETRSLYDAIRAGQMPELPPTGAPRRAPTGRPAAPAASPLDAEIPLIGRQVELDLLHQAARQAANGQGAVLLIAGETGIGKTRLRQQFAASQSGSTLFSLTCYELDSLAPFAALRSSLPAVIAPAENRPDAWANALLTHSRRTAAPLVLLLDDFHWADLSTWELLGWLARRTGEAPLLLVALYRPEDLQPEQREWLARLQRSRLVTHHTLPPFTPAETAELVRRLAPEHADDPIFLQRLQRETGGNPLFLAETLRALRENAPLELPGSVRAIFEARIHRLAPESRAALGAAAVFGRAFSFGMLQRITGVDDRALVALLEEWAQRGLVLEEQGQYDFRHDQIRTTAYAALSPTRRQFLHGQVAEALQEAIPPAEPATLAYHYARSERPHRALPWLIQAGEQALNLRAYHEARQFGLQALRLLGQLPGPQARSERADIQLQLAQAHAFSGDLPRAIQLLSETLDWAHDLGDPLRLGFIHRRLAQFFWLQGDPQTAASHARRALQLAEESGHARLELAALRMLGRVSIALADFDDAILFLNRHTRQPEAPAHQQAVALGYLGVAYARVGAWDAAYEAAHRALELAEHALDPAAAGAHAVFTRVQLAMVAADRHDWAACLDALSPITWPDAPAEWTPALYMALSLRGLARAQNGNPSAGRRDLEQALAWAAEQDYRVFHYLPRLFLGQACLLAGDLDAAGSAAQQALTAASTAGNRWAAALAHTLLAEIAQRSPRPDWPQVEDHLLKAVDLLRSIRARPDLARAYLALRRLYDRAGRIAWAVDCHFRAVAIFEELDMPAELRAAQGRPAAHSGGGVLPDLPLRGPNASSQN